MTEGHTQEIKPDVADHFPITVQSEDVYYSYPRAICQLLQMHLMMSRQVSFSY